MYDIQVKIDCLVGFRGRDPCNDMITFFSNNVLNDVTVSCFVGKL